MAVKFEVNLTNRWLYTLIVVGILLILSIGVLAYTSSIPNPGHGADNIWVSVGGTEKTLQQAFDSGIQGIDYSACYTADTGVDRPLSSITTCSTNYVMVGLAGGYGHSSAYNHPHRIKCCRLK